jgi:hypothetical protein
MTSDSLPVVGVLHSPYGAVNLMEIARSAAGLCRPVILIRKPVARRHPDVVAMAGRLFEVHVLDGAAVDVVHRIRPVGLTTFHDDDLEHLDAALSAAGLPGAATVANPWDKLTQRRRLWDRGLGRVHAEAVDSIGDFRSAVATVGLPAVLKPRRSVGGAGIAFLRDDSDVAYQARHRRRWSGLLVENMLADGVHSGGTDWLADFVSVETICTDELRHVAVFDKSPVTVIRRAGSEGSDIVSVTGDVTPSRLPPAAAAEVLAYVSASLSALGVRWRVTHTEVKLTPTGPEIIEVNGRVGGHLNRLLRLVGGPDLVKAALTVAMGRLPDTVTSVPQGFAMGYFPPFPDRSGAVRSHVQPRDLRALPGVVGVDEIAAVGRERAETGYRMANVTMFAAAADQLDAARAQTVEGISGLFAADLPAQTAEVPHVGV